MLALERLSPLERTGGAKPVSGIEDVMKLQTALARIFAENQSRLCAMA